MEQRCVICDPVIIHNPFHTGNIICSVCHYDIISAAIDNGLYDQLEQLSGSRNNISEDSSAESECSSIASNSPFDVELDVDIDTDVIDH